MHNTSQAKPVIRTYSKQYADIVKSLEKASMRTVQPYSQAHSQRHSRIHGIPAIANQYRLDVVQRAARNPAVPLQGDALSSAFSKPVWSLVHAPITH